MTPIPELLAKPDDPEDPEGVAYALDMPDGDVPLAGWTDLAKAFVDRCLPNVGPEGT